MLDAELLLGYINKTSREHLLANPEEKISFFRAKRFQNLVNQRSQNIPLAYLTGHKELFGLDFLINKHVLVPRPETEILVEETIKEIQKKPDQNILLIDIGTGSGNILISILKNIGTKNLTAWGTDISPSALRLAKKNAKKHQTKIIFKTSDLLSSLPQRLFTKFDQLLITANLPYLTREQFQNEPSIHREPKIALLADNDGMQVYQKLIEQMTALPSKLSWWMIWEIDPLQAVPLTQYVQKTIPQTKIRSIPDLANRTRFLVMEKLGWN